MAAPQAPLAQSVATARAAASAPFWSDAALLHEGADVDHQRGHADQEHEAQRDQDHGGPGVVTGGQPPHRMTPVAVSVFVSERKNGMS